MTAEQVLQARQLLDSTQWIDGRVTAGHQSSRTKDNLQLPEGHPVAVQLGEMILEALGQNALFISAAHSEADIDRTIAAARETLAGSNAN